ncbi:hypothetical protein Tco_1423730 [Tanacetum coccineum]
MLNRLYSTSYMVVLLNIRAYSDYDFFDGHRMQSGGRKGIRFYLMEMDCMLSTSGWLVCELIQKLRQKEVDEESCMKTCSMNWGEANLVYTSYIVSYASNGKIQAGALIFVLIGYITKAARYEIKGIKDMVPTLWSTIKHAYDKDALMGIKHWGERQSSVKKLHGYGHLEEIMVKISDQQLYMFKEGDFVDLHLNDIEDMLLLAVQHKLFNLEGEYLDKQKRVLRADELYKFSNGTLKSVRDEILHRVLDFSLDYNTKMPKRKWAAVD